MSFLYNATDEESAEVIAMQAAERNFSNEINKGYQIETQIQRVDMQKLNQLLKGEIQTVFPYNDSILNDDFLT